jgi:hypothetical protein
MAVGYTAKGDSFATGKPRVWTPTEYWRLFEVRSCAGRQALAAILAPDASGDKPPTHLTFLLNFFDELLRRAPANK